MRRWESANHWAMTLQGKEGETSLFLNCKLPNTNYDRMVVGLVGDCRGRELVLLRGEVFRCLLICWVGWLWGLRVVHFGEDGFGGG